MHKYHKMSILRFLYFRNKWPISYFFFKLPLCLEFIICIYSSMGGSPISYRL